MHRKILAICAALVALGALMAMPAMSSAALLKETTGAVSDTVANNSKIVAYNEVGTTTKLTSALGTIECTEATITGKVHNNGVSGGVVTGTIEDAFFRGSQTGTKCKGPLGDTTVTIPSLTSGGGTTHWCIETKANTDEFLVTPDGCTTSATGHVFTFIIHAGGLTCGFSRVDPILGHFKTDETVGSTTPVTLEMTDEQEFKTDAVSGHSVFCPSSGKLDDFEFELFTDTDPSTPGIWRHAASVADPVVITK